LPNGKTAKQSLGEFVFGLPDPRHGFGGEEAVR